MALEKISAIILPHQVKPHAQRTPLAPAPGDILHLSPDSIVGDDVLAKHVDGQVLRLAGMGSLLARQMTTGELLLLQVVQSTPHLVLRLIDSKALATSQPSASSVLDFDAMRTDQLAMRQMSWARPDPAWIAANWHTQVINRLRAMDSAAAQTAAKHLFLSQAQRHEASMNFAPGLPESDRWLFHVFGWGGMSMRLRLARQVYDEQRRTVRASQAYVVQLEFELPGWGWVRLLVRLVNREVHLRLEVEKKEIADRLKTMGPHMQATLAGSGLRLAHADIYAGGQHSAASLGRNGQFMEPDQGYPSRALFRAAVDIALALTAYCGNAASPAYR